MKKPSMLTYFQFYNSQGHLNSSTRALSWEEIFPSTNNGEFIWLFSLCFFLRHYFFFLRKWPFLIDKRASVAARPRCQQQELALHSLLGTDETSPNKGLQHELATCLHVLPPRGHSIQQQRSRHRAHSYGCVSGDDAKGCLLTRLWWPCGCCTAGSVGCFPRPREAVEQSSVFSIWARRLNINKAGEVLWKNSQNENLKSGCFNCSRLAPLENKQFNTPACV